MPKGVMIAASNQMMGPLTVGTFSCIIPAVICRKVKLTSQIPTRNTPRK